MKPLFAARWENTLSSEADLIGDTAMLSPERVGVRWNIEYGGLQRIELQVKARNKWDAYARYSSHHGQRAGVFAYLGYRPCTGFITAVDYGGAGRMLYTIEGPAPTRMLSELDTTVYSSAGAISTTITSILGNMPTRVDNAITSNIETNSTALGGWQPPVPQGGYPLEMIQELLKVPNSSGTIYHFWLVDEVMRHGRLRKWMPHYHGVASSAAADWVVGVDDIKDLSLSRNIKNIKTNVTVYYGTITGTHDGLTRGATVTGTHNAGGNSATLVDTTKNFKQAGVMRGDIVQNTTDGSFGVVASINTAVNPFDRINFDDDGMTGGTDNDWDVSDAYSIKTHASVGQHTGSNNAAALTDSGASFLAEGVFPGDKVENLTDGSSGIVGSVTATVATLSAILDGGTDNDFDTNDYYVITLQKVIFDSTANFIDEGVKPGDRAANLTDGSRGTVTAVYTNMLILDRLSGGADNRFDTGDTYSVTLQDPRNVEVSTVTPSYWIVDSAEIEPGMTATQAAQYASAIKSTEPEQVQAFTITAPHVSGNRGGRFPLYSMILRGGGYIRIHDLYQTANLYSNSKNRKTTFFITSMDYDHTTNTMRVGVDSVDRRLDVRLRREGILGSEIINQGNREEYAY